MLQIYKILNVLHIFIYFGYFFKSIYSYHQMMGTFQRRFLQCWTTLKQRCEYDHLKKIKMKSPVKNKIIFLSFGLQIFLILFPILRGIYIRIFAQWQKFLKHRIY